MLNFVFLGLKDKVRTALYMATWRDMVAEYAIIYNTLPYRPEGYGTHPPSSKRNCVKIETG